MDIVSYFKTGYNLYALAYQWNKMNGIGGVIFFVIIYFKNIIEMRYNTYTMDEK